MLIYRLRHSRKSWSYKVVVLHLKSSLDNNHNSSLPSICNFTNESAKLRALRAHVPTCLTCLRAHMPTCLECLRANVLCVLPCSRANVSCVFPFSRANIPCVLTSSLANVLCVVTYSRGNLSCVLTSERVLRVYELKYSRALRAPVFTC